MTEDADETTAEDLESVLARTGRLSLTDGGLRVVAEVRTMPTDDEHRGARGFTNGA
jgi:hypothetical protein